MTDNSTETKTQDTKGDQPSSQKCEAGDKYYEEYQ